MIKTLNTIARNIVFIQYIFSTFKGNWTAYYENGVLWSKAQYDNGQKDGLWKVYKPDGKLYSEIKYRNGKKLFGRLYDDTGKVIEKKVFEDYLTND